MLTVTSATSAQSHVTLPFGTANVEGNTANPVPWWSTSGTYQQVHDDLEMLAGNSGGPITITGIGFRTDGVFTAPYGARTLEVQLTLGITGLDSRTAGTDFAANLGPQPTVVMPFTRVDIPTLLPISVPNPVGFVMSFVQPFVFQAQPGNHFCWEMRHRFHSYLVADNPFDANESNVVIQETLGAGCVVVGRNLPASITTRTWNLTTGAYRNILTRARPNAPATFFLGLQPASWTLPGLCSTLELMPAFFLAGSTTSTGSFDVSIATNRRFVGIPATTLYGQFAFLDGDLPWGLGLSDASRLSTPIPTFSSRFYTAPSQGGPGNELATTATGLTRDFGLVTILRVQ